MRAKPKWIETRQVPRTRSRSNGVTDAIIAAAWLNAARSSQTRARVLQIRDQLETLEKMLDSLCRKTQERRAYLKGRTALPPPEKLKQIHEDAELQERLRVSHNALNDALSAYACPVMTYDVASGAWRSNMISRKSRGPQIKVPLDGERVAVVDAPSVVDALVRLAASRQLYKLRL